MRSRSRESPAKGLLPWTCIVLRDAPNSPRPRGVTESGPRDGPMVPCARATTIESARRGEPNSPLFRSTQQSSGFVFEDLLSFILEERVDLHIQGTTRWIFKYWEDLGCRVKSQFTVRRWKHCGPTFLTKTAFCVKIKIPDCTGCLQKIWIIRMFLYERLQHLCTIEVKMAACSTAIL